MSKKILKRSLALGALMAFVITGNVYAESLVADKTVKGIGNHESAMAGESHDLQWTLNGFRLLVNDGAGWNKDYAVCANNYNIQGTEEGSVLEIRATKGLGLNGTVNVDSLLIDTYSEAIYAARQTNVTANNVDINAEVLAVRMEPGDGKLNIVANKRLNLIGDINGWNNVIKIDASNATQVAVTGDVYSKGGSNVDISLGANGHLNSKVVTDDISSTALTMGNGITWNIIDDSAVTKIVVDGDTTIDGTKEDGGKSSLTSNRNLTTASEYLIEHKGGTLTINNLVIKDVVKENQGDSTGSIIKRNNGGKIIITNSEFSNNQNVRADGFSGKTYAIIDIDSDMDISDTKFLNNKTDYMGGALYLHNKEFNITSSTFENNTALQGAAIQSNGAKITLTDDIFKNNVATKDNDGDCGGAICAEGASELIFEGTNNSFESNKATGTNGNGGAIAQYKGAKELTTIIFAEGSSTEFKNNTANNNGGAIWNGDGGVIEVNGKLNFTGNTANGKGNDIYNIGTININQGAKVKLDGGIDGTGTTNINGGTLELAGGETNIVVLGGNDGVIHFTNAEAKLAVTKNENETLKFTATSAVNEAVAGDANKLINQVAWAKDTTMVMEAGEVVGEITAELVEGKDGKLVVKSQTEATNTKNQSIGEAGVSLKLHYRAHMNDMNKRMGELRNANGEYGVWTRMVRGESEYKNTKAQYNLYQLGYDEKLSVDKRWTVGAAVTFAEGDANYGQGSTDDKSTAFAIYGTKLNNDGTFVDLIARYAHIESDFDDRNSGKGDYSTNGMSVSAEFGKRIQQGNGLWIEPQVELTYGTVDSAEFQLGGKTVTVGDMDSIIGRVGFSLGKDIKQGNVYARASYLYDFDGETENAFSANGVTRTIAEDLGGGWWEVGVGANINLSKATYIYADVEKTFGGEVDTNWQWNLGVRYSF